MTGPSTKRPLSSGGPLTPQQQEWVDRHAPAPIGANEFHALGPNKPGKQGNFASKKLSEISPPSVLPPSPPKATHPCSDVAPRSMAIFIPGDALALSAIEEKMWPYMVGFVQFLRKYVPGFEQATLLVTSPFFHARGGKSIDPVRAFTWEDLAGQVRLDDVILRFFGDKVFQLRSGWRRYILSHVAAPESRWVAGRRSQCHRTGSRSYACVIGSS